MQTATPAAGQDLRGHLEGIELACAVGRTAVAHVDALERHVVGDDLARGQRGAWVAQAERGQGLGFGSMGPK